MKRIAVEDCIARFRRLRLPHLALIALLALLAPYSFAVTPSAVVENNTAVPTYSENTALDPRLFCPFASDKTPIATTSDADMISAGYIGSSYKLIADGNTLEGAAYYKIVAKMPDGVIVESRCALGGDNTLSSLFYVGYDSSGLHIRNIYGGEVGDGEVLVIKQQANTLFYTVSLPIAHLLSLVQIDPNTIKPKKTVCKTCMFATETFSRTLEPTLGSQQTVAIEINQQALHDQNTCMVDVAYMSKQHNQIMIKPHELQTFSERIQLCQTMQAKVGEHWTSFLLRNLPPSIWPTS